LDFWENMPFPGKSIRAALDKDRGEQKNRYNIQHIISINAIYVDIKEAFGRS
jgi:hypothetical protein